MAISFKCNACGRSYTTTDQWAEKSVKCKQCGQAIKIPRAAAASPPQPDDVYGLDEAESEARPGAAWAKPLSAPGLANLDGRPSEPKASKWKPPKAPEKSGSSKGLFGGVGGAVVVVALIGLRAYNTVNRNRAREARQGNQAAQSALPFQDIQIPGVPPAFQGAWIMPALPQLPRGVELEPGVIFHEIQLPGKKGAGAAAVIPAHAGKLWVYLPAGARKAKSLGCILIAGAGSNLVTGMDLGDGDRAEHIPYVKAGYAVVAYELDGAAPESANTNGLAILPYMRAFLNAQAGLLNARVAFEYATTRVAAINPGRLYAAGHSSAATLALLVAENEPRLAACIAYAPAVDVASEFQPVVQETFTKLLPGANELFTKFNPRTSEAKINCPLFLFYANDDQRFANKVRDLAERLKAAGKSVTLETAPSGGHYDSMIEVGIPRGIEWLSSVPKPRAL